MSPIHILRPLVQRRPGLFGKKSMQKRTSKEKKAKKAKRTKRTKKAKRTMRKTRLFGVAGLGYEGSGYPETYVDYFGSSIPFVQPPIWAFPVVNDMAQSNPAAIAYPLP
jgi:hypothetical protein